MLLGYLRITSRLLYSALFPYGYNEYKVCIRNAFTLGHSSVGVMPCYSVPVCHMCKLIFFYETQTYNLRVFIGSI